MRIPDRLKAWIDARKRHHLSHVQIQMARELGMNPDKLGKLDNHGQEPWKAPLPAFIEDLYRKRFGKDRPAVVRPAIPTCRDGMPPVRWSAIGRQRPIAHGTLGEEPALVDPELWAVVRRQLTRPLHDPPLHERPARSSEMGQQLILRSSWRDTMSCDVTGGWGCHSSSGRTAGSSRFRPRVCGYPMTATRPPPRRGPNGWCHFRCRLASITLRIRGFELTLSCANWAISPWPTSS